MNLDNLKSAAETIGIFAIVASLIFVGLQMRQTHEIALVTLYQMRSDAAREFAAAQLESGVLISIDEKLALGQKLSAREQVLEAVPHFLFFNHFENSHYMYQMGFLTEEHWESDLVAVEFHVKSNAGALSYWEDQKVTFRPTYVREIDRVLSKPD